MFSRQFVLAGIIGVLSLLGFGYRLADEPFFADETACYAGTFYYRLLREAKFEHIDWLHPASYDHSPMGKYILGASLEIQGKWSAIPTSVRTWETWMLGRYAPPADREALLAMRRGVALVSAIGCAVAFLIGSASGSTFAGIAFSACLFASPLYYMHARRAMYDNPTIMFALLGIYFSILFTKQLAVGRQLSPGSIFTCVLATIFFSLGIETKMNALSPAFASGLVISFAIMIASSGTIQGRGLKLVLLATSMAALAVGVILLINPYLWAKPTIPKLEADGPATLVIEGVKRTRLAVEEFARLAPMNPWQRAAHRLEHRRTGLGEAMNQFPNDALRTMTVRLQHLYQDGVGRWSFVGRLRLPAVPRYYISAALVYGLIAVSILMPRERISLAGLYVLVWFFVESCMLLNQLTLNWDRYYLGFVVAFTGLFSESLCVTVTQLLRVLQKKR